MKAQIPDETNCLPLHPRDVLSLLKGAPIQWWITGGWALDMFLGKHSRPHFDTDIAIARCGQLAAQHYLSKWEFYSTKREENGDIVLRQWESDEFLGYEYPGVWARKPRKDLWRFEFLFHEIDDQIWTFRYDSSLKHPISEIGGISSDGIPYLVPEISLLYKAARLRDVDEQDFQQVLPRLKLKQREQLAADIKKFAPEHPWLAALI